MITTEELGYTSEIEKIAASNSELSTRNVALDMFHKNGIPNKKNDAWRYSKILATSIKGLKLATATTSPVIVDEFKQIMHHCTGIYFVNGKLHNAASAKQFQFEASYINKDISNSTLGSFDYLNVALGYKGADIIVPDNTIIEQPIFIFHGLLDSADSMMHPQNRIIIGKNSEVSIIECYLSSNSDKCLINLATSITVGNNSKLKHTLWHETSTTDANHISDHQINLKQDATINSEIFSVNPRLGRANYHIHSGKSTSSDIAALIYSENNTSFDLNLFVEHDDDNGISRSQIRSIATDKATASCTGKIMVKPSAVNVDAALDCKSLLLSSTAAINNRPQLEIYNDDVKCSHGCSIGQLDKDALYYLQSRGIDLETAKSLLIHSFIHPVLSKLETPLRQRLLTAYPIMELV